MAGLFESLLIGVSLAAIPGPIFFELIRRTLARGFLSGALLALGEFIGNSLLFSLVYFGASSFLSSALSRLALYLAGGCILIWLAAAALRLKAADVESSYGRETGSADSLLAGLVIAATSPIVIALWVSLSGSYLAELQSADAILNILLVSSGVLAFFLLLGAGISKTRHRIAPGHVLLLSKISGAILALYGASFLYQFVLLLS
ncbi:MAG TPA: LysE family transporter [Candidatus Bilamarchaeum sp.]|nr:LysE family transporter [Candidatus Bilamarchaeum sp.]